MVKNEALNKSMVCSKEKSGAKLAKLFYEVIGKNDDLKLVRIDLQTGRHHQIRVQFSSRGFPLYGDQKYGTGPKGEQIALWAYKVNFKHPTKDEVVSLEDKPKRVGVWKNFSI